jgi:hypothetical protein
VPGAWVKQYWLPDSVAVSQAYDRMALREACSSGTWTLGEMDGPGPSDRM